MIMSNEVAFEDTQVEQPAPPVEVETDDGMEAGEAELVAEEDRRPRPPRKSEKPKIVTLGTRETKSMAELRNNDDKAIKEWMEEISSTGAIRVKVERTSPKTWKGLNVGGNLARYDHPIDEEWVRDHHGGGDFMLTVQKPRLNGAGWVYAGARVIHIAGDPRTDDVFRDKGPEPQAQTAAPSAAIADKAFGVLERELAAARSQGSQHHGVDPAMIQAITGPMQAQIAQMGAMLRDAQAQLAAAQQSKPVERDEFREKMLSAMIDGDSARMVSLRAQHDSELRQVKQSAIDNEARLRDSFERDKQMMAMAHERELNALRSAYDMKVASQETLNQTSKTLLEGEIRRLDAALTKAESELAALRLKKDKTILEQATEFAAIKEAIGEITGDETKEKSTLEKVMEVAGNLPAVQNAIGKLAGEGQHAPAQQQVAQMPQAPNLVTGPDGHLYQMVNGRPVLIRRRRQVAAQTAAPDGTHQPGTQPLPEIAPATVKIAVDFLESAYRNGQDPTEVATSVRSMVPTDVLAAIKQLGIDGFLTNVAKLDAGSPLSSQAGRNWTRKLGKALLGE
jgi:hypothetical protein